MLSYMRKGDLMKPDYKNWMPEGLVISAIAAFAICMICSVLSSLYIAPGSLKSIVLTILLLLSIVFAYLSLKAVMMFRAFSYNGRRKLSKEVIDGIAARISLSKGQKGLDVGCGSGALVIACARRNPDAAFVGIDRWGKEYASFSKSLCQSNAKAEGVSNVTFRQGNAVKLPFEDECFDAVFSNYVYHNIPSHDRQEILMETLRVLKKGGTFAIHDIFTKGKYGDMQAFVKKLKDMGYEKVDLIDTTNGLFMTRKEAGRLMLTGSALLTGRK